MFRSLLVAGVLLGLSGIARTAPAPEAKPSRGDQLLANLRKTVKFTGFEADPKLALSEALGVLGEEYDLTFEVNEAAFRAQGVNDVMIAPVAEKALPAQERTTPAAVLKRVLARLPVESGAAWLLRADGIEITTRAALQAEVWGPDYQGPFLPLVCARFERLPLADALQDLADQGGFNVVLDPRAGDKARTPVTARLRNLPLDTAVETLADMAGLKAVRTDNVLYVSADGRGLKGRPDAAAPAQTPLVPETFAPGLAAGATLPRKQVAFDKKPLQDALKELTDGTGYGLVIDAARLGDKVKTPVSLEIKDAPVDTAVRLLADLAGLRAVVMDNVVYLTTPENAKELQADQDQRLLQRMYVPINPLPRR